MKACLLTVALACIVAPAVAAEKSAGKTEKVEKADVKSEDIVAPAPSTGGATVIYRQILPNGRVVYSDKPLKGAKVDHTLTVEPPIRGNLWTTDAGPRPDIPPQTERTPVKKVNVVPVSGQKKSVADAESEVIRAEMLLEDAKKRLQAGAEPLPGERSSTANGNSKLNDAYTARQKALAHDVEEAEAALRQAVAERDAVLHTR